MTVGSGKNFGVSGGGTGGGVIRAAIGDDEAIRNILADSSKETGNMRSFIVGRNEPNNVTGPHAFRRAWHGTAIGLGGGR